MNRRKSDTTFVDEPDVELFLECSLCARSHIGRNIYERPFNAVEPLQPLSL